METGTYQHRDQDARYLEEGEDKDFACNDDAGYTNVNQCMKFQTKTTMLTQHHFGT
jgi:hypothetical protein